MIGPKSGPGFRLGLVRGGFGLGNLAGGVGEDELNPARLMIGEIVEQFPPNQFLALSFIHRS